MNNIEKIGNVILDYTYYPGEDMYSEGAAEDVLLDYVMTHTAADYEEYIQTSRSWSVMYHLSHIRENVASWLPIREGDTVLEVGSGCGAITGALARVAKSVTCVELSKKRSLINAYRNKEYDNVTIKVGNFQTIEPTLEDKYDFITLIGVYEYAQSYISGENPYNQFLQILKQHLKPGGKIVIAIENRLGLKYFAGCKEDHLGEYFAGITGYGANDGVRTFSKKSLISILEQEGMNYKFYYPYPDYKLPHTIYSDDKLPEKGDLDTNLRNFDGDRMLLFDEKKAFDTFIEEGVFPEYSNSFIVMASPDSDWDKEIILPIYVKYANERMEEYRVDTMIAKRANGEKFVFKGALSTKANNHVKALAENCVRLSKQYEGTGLVPANCQYIKGVERMLPIVGVAPKAKDIALFEYLTGETLEDKLKGLEDKGEFEEVEKIILDYCDRLNRSKDTLDFVPCAKFNEIFGKREFTKSYIATEPCNLDMIFSNIVIESGSNNWKVLDYEWVLNFPVPISFVIYRTIYYHFRDREDCGFARYLAQKGMDVYSLCGIDIGERMLFKEMEHSFQVYIIGGVASLDVMRVLMPSATMNVDQLVSVGSYLKNLDTPKIYFSRAKTFSEDNQITLIGKLDNNVVSFRVPIDRYLSSIRIDPTDYPCLVHINSVALTMNDGTTQEVDKIIINGYIISGDTYLFDTDDPQIIIEDIPQEARSLEVSYAVTMFDKVFYDEFASLFAEEEYEEKEQENKKKRSLPYRVKRKIGLIKEDNLPGGYKRVILGK